MNRLNLYYQILSYLQLKLEGKIVNSFTHLVFILSFWLSTAFLLALTFINIINILMRWLINVSNLTSSNLGISNVVLLVLLCLGKRHLSYLEKCPLYCLILSVL